MYSSHGIQFELLRFVCITHFFRVTFLSTMSGGKQKQHNALLFIQKEYKIKKKNTEIYLSFMKTQVASSQAYESQIITFTPQLDIKPVYFIKPDSYMREILSKYYFKSYLSMVSFQCNIGKQTKAQCNAKSYKILSILIIQIVQFCNERSQMLHNIQHNNIQHNSITSHPFGH